MQCLHVLCAAAVELGMFVCFMYNSSNCFIFGLDVPMFACFSVGLHSLDNVDGFKLMLLQRAKMLSEIF